VDNGDDKPYDAMTNKQTILALKRLINQTESVKTVEWVERNYN